MCGCWRSWRRRLGSCRAGRQASLRLRTPAHMLSGVLKSSRQRRPRAPCAFRTLSQRAPQHYTVNILKVVFELIVRIQVLLAGKSIGVPSGINEAYHNRVRTNQDYQDYQGIRDGLCGLID